MQSKLTVSWSNLLTIFTQNQWSLILQRVWIGSCHSLLEFKSDNDEEKKWIKSYIANLANTINYILLNSIMENKEWEEYWRKMLSLVIDEMRRPLVNQKRHSVVGWQYDVSYKEEFIYDFRLNEYCYLIHHWEESWSWIIGRP